MYLILMLTCIRLVFRHIKKPTVPPITICKNLLSVMLMQVVILQSEANAQKTGVDSQAGSKSSKTMITQSIIMPMINAEKMAELYEKYSGLQVIVTESAKHVKFSVAIEASPKSPVSSEEAAIKIQTSAIMESMVFRKSQSNASKCFLEKTVIAPDFEIYDASTILPQGDDVVYYVMKLKHIKPKVAIEILNRQRSKAALPYQLILEMPNTSAIVIQDRPSELRKMIAIQKDIDVISVNQNGSGQP